MASNRFSRTFQRLGRSAEGGLKSALRVRPSALANGIAVSVGVALVALLSQALVPEHAASLMLGAICASVADTPVPVVEKLKRIGLGWAVSSLSVLAARSAEGIILPGLAVTGIIGFCAAMVTAYGRNVIPVMVSILLALVLSESSVRISGGTPFVAAMWFSLGGICYAAYAAVSTPLLMRPTRAILLREALKALASYLRAQHAAFLSDGTTGQVYAALIDAQAVLAERIQAARNVLFVALRGDDERQLAAQLLVGIDILEAALSTQADLDALRETGNAEDEKLQALRGLLLLAASDLDRLARGVSDPASRSGTPIADRTGLFRRITTMSRDGESLRQSMLQATADKMEVLFAHIDRLQLAQSNPSVGAGVIGRIDLKPFVQRTRFDLATLRRELHWHSPIFRYAVRLALAMCCGFLVGSLLPEGAHGSWILLTVALVMRGSYSVTRQRRYERLSGNIFGCLVAGVLLWVAPGWLVTLIIFVAVGGAHAFAAQNYFIASVASCVMALLQIHVAAPDEDIFLLMRVVDTGIGALIAYAFSYILPHWESQSVARLAADLHQAELDGARRTLAIHTSDQEYRLARRRLFDAIANLSAAVTRMLDEPKAQAGDARKLSEALAAAYVFAAELASVRVFLRSRADLQDSRLAAALDHARLSVEQRLAGAGGTSPPSKAVHIDSLDAETYEGAGRLARRLRRLIQSADRVQAARKVA